MTEFFIQVPSRTLIFSLLLNSSRAPGPLRPARTIQSCRPTLATAPPRSSRPSSSSGSPLSSAPPSNALGLEGSLAWFNHSPPDYLYHHQLFSTVESLPSTVSHDPPFDTFSQESELWADLDLSLTESDWTSLSINHSTPYPTSFDGVTVSDVGYGMASTFASLSDSGPNESQFCLAPSVTASSANSQSENLPICRRYDLPNTLPRWAFPCLTCISDSRFCHDISV